MGQRHKISNARTTSYLTSNCLSYLKTIFIAFLFKCFFWKETPSNYSYNKILDFTILQWMSFLNWQRFWDRIYMKWYYEWPLRAYRSKQCLLMNAMIFIYCLTCLHKTSCNSKLQTKILNYTQCWVILCL